MIHTAYFWLKKDITDEQRVTFETELIRVKEIDYLVHGFVGKPALTEKRAVTDHSFDYSITLHFKNLEDHERYQKSCPEHLCFINICKPLWERVLVYDSSPIH